MIWSFVLQIDEELKNVIKNATYLLLTQGLTYIAPILVLGYLIHTLGVEGFGMYAITLAVIAYIQVVVDYGFSFSASREISQNRDNKTKVSNVYFTTTFVKITICIVCYPIYLVLLSYFVDDIILYYSLNVGYLTVIGNALFPIWFYQGIERLKIVAIINMLSRLISCLLVFIFVRQMSDVPTAVFVQAAPIILGGLLANANIFYKKLVIFNRPKCHDIYQSLIHGWDFFLATLASTILSNSAVFILGIYTNPSVVGAYAAVERIIKAITSLFAPLTQSVYPYNCQKFGISKSAGFASVKKTGKPIVILAALATIFIFLMSNFLVSMTKLPPSSVLISYLLSVWLFLGVFNNVLGIQTLSAAGHAKLYSRCFIIASFLTIIMMCALIYYFQSIGAAIALMIGEGILFGLLLYKVKPLITKSNEN